jgi:hypothetical protein
MVLAATPNRLFGARLSKGKFTGADLVFNVRLTTLQFPGVRSALRVVPVA